MALLMSGVFTMFLLVVMGMVLWTTRTAATPALAGPETASVVSATDATTADQAALEQVQADMAAREEQYKARLTELEQLAKQRAADYQARLNEAATQLSTYEAQLDQTRRAEVTYASQAVQLQKALKDRKALFATRRQEYEAQRQTQLGQLQTQLNEAVTKLQEAKAQLGQ
jgi:chromosome segregation ATPase